MARVYSLGELANQLQAELVGDPTVEINGLGSLESASATQLSHLSNPAYRRYLKSSLAGAVLLRPEDAADWHGNALLVKNPYLAFARASTLFAVRDQVAPGIDASAHISHAAVIGAEVAIGPGVVIEAGAEIGSGVIIHANCVVGADCLLADGVVLHPNVVLYHGVVLGARTEIHAGAVLGADGFGFTPDERGHLVAIAQLGGLCVGSDVSVGAASTIDRGTIEDTVIEDGVKIDNQVQIGHNCRIGAHSVVCGCVGIVGSTRIGRHCVLAGGVGVGGSTPIEICDGVTVSGMTHVSASIDEPGIYSGGVLHSRSRLWKRNALRLKELDALFRRVARLERGR